MFSNIFSYGDKFTILFKNDFVTIIKIILTSVDDIVNGFCGFFNICETLTITNMLAKYVFKSTSLIAPHYINIANIVFMEDAL